MSTNQLLQKIESLPENLRKEALDFIEFLATKSKKTETLPAKPIRKSGLAKGMIHIKKDFDEPLKEFNDYM